MPTSRKPTLADIDKAKNDLRYADAVEVEALNALARAEIVLEQADNPGNRKQAREAIRNVKHLIRDCKNLRKDAIARGGDL